MNDSLFSFEEAPESQISASSEPGPISDHQLVAIRKAFAEAGIQLQEDRQSLVESCAMRPIAALRELTTVEARRVLNRIQTRSAGPVGTGGSAWDDREEETWIDKL